MQVAAIGDDVVFCTAMERANRDHGRVGRSDFTGNDRLQVDNEVRCLHNGVDRCLRISAVSALSFEFDVDTVAAYGPRERERLLQDAGIIRNRLKIDAAIENALRIQALRMEFGNFANWLDAHHPMAKEDWVKLFRKTFKFTGGEITGEFLMSTGYLPGAHRSDCPIYTRIAELNPRWQEYAAG